MRLALIISASGVAVSLPRDVVVGNGGLVGQTGIMDVRAFFNFSEEEGGLGGKGRLVGWLAG